MVLSLCRFRILTFALVFILLCNGLLSQENLPAKKKIGISFTNVKANLRLGNLYINGDVRPELFDGFGVGVGIEKSITSLFRYRLSYLYGSTYGLELKPSGGSLHHEPKVFDGYGENNEWFYSYNTKYSCIDFAFLLNLTDLAPRFKKTKYTVYAGAGLGLGTWDTKLNLKDENDLSYSNLRDLTSFDLDNEYNTIAGRRAIRDILLANYDDTYDTPAHKEIGIFRPGNETNVMVSYNLLFGISFRLTNKVALNLEHEFKLSRNDYLDGKSWITETDKSSDKDIFRFTSLGLSVNIDRNSHANPLNHWDELALEMDAKIDSLSIEPTDSDNDGVIDLLDKEPGSMSDCPVDKNGVTLDSDKDGIPDCIDSSPYINESQLNELINQALNANAQNATKDTVIIIKNIAEEARTGEFRTDSSVPTTLPLIYFDYNSSSLSDESLKKLVRVYLLLRENKELKLELLGHSSELGTEAYNLKLSEERISSVEHFLSDICGLDSSRVVSTAFGETKGMVSSEEYSFLNQRVELRIIK